MNNFKIFDRVGLNQILMLFFVFLAVFVFTPRLSEAQEALGKCTLSETGETRSNYTEDQCAVEVGTWVENNNNGIPINTGSTPTGTGTPATATPINPPAELKGLVPCDNVGIKCDFVQLMKLINGVIDFIFKFMVVPIAAIMFAYAGILLVTAPGGEAKTKAKKIFTNAVIGLVLAAAAWLIVRTLLSILGYTAIGTYF